MALSAEQEAALAALADGLIASGTTPDEIGSLVGLTKISQASSGAATALGAVNAARSTVDTAAQAAQLEIQAQRDEIEAVRVGLTGGTVTPEDGAARLAAAGAAVVQAVTDYAAALASAAAGLAS